MPAQPCALAMPTRPTCEAQAWPNTLADQAIAGNGECSLREAITNANNNTDSTNSDCAAGNGADTITFTVDGKIALASMLPLISSEMTIDGSGQSVMVSR